MPIIPGYQIIAEVKTSVNTIIYRGIRECDYLPVIIKIIKNEYPTLEQLTHLRHEYEITQSLAQNFPIEVIVKSYDLVDYHHGLALILEDFGGISLQIWLQSQPIKLSEFFFIAINITEALLKLHKKNITHKDIKPQNIIINPKTGQIKITDFSIASSLCRENLTLFGSPSLLEGTLAYMSPEQTGRMNRAIDYRTDFYSLGVTFYEILTGQLPFTTQDPLELVHCHIAKQPILPHQLNPEIPKAVSDIVMKLLAKTAEDRYQTASGLKYDLEICWSQLQNTGQIFNFIPGQQDLSGQFQIPQKLYGREAEVMTLLNTFERVSQGTTEIMLVSGYSGIGKSSLVNEIHKPIVRQRGYFINGKFDQFQRDIPYVSLIQAFQDLMRQLLTESSEQIAVWKVKLLDALGANGQIIIDVIPEVELIVGKQPPVAQLGANESQNRFKMVLKNFIHIFTQKIHPLVVFLDDLQWADSASLNLIRLLVTDPESQYLFLIGAYRDNEVNAAHGLMLTLEEIANQAKVNTITLQPLDINNVNQLIADTLSCDQQKTQPLAELLFNKTAGNPFFVTQLMKSLHQENLLSYNINTNYWQWDIQQLQDIGITDNVVELMVSKIQQLNEDTQNVLKLAACIGNKFDLNILSIVNEKSLSSTASELWQTLEAGLILPVDNAYKIPLAYQQEADVVLQNVAIYYKFLHDRVQQAAYSLIPEADKKAVHFKVGRLILKNIHQSELEEKIFDIVNHLNIGRELITDPQSRIEIANLNLIAGRKAKASTAYKPALQHLTLGIELLSINSWKDDYELTYGLYKECAECQFLTGNYAQALKLFDIALINAQSNFEQADIYLIQMKLSMNQGENFQAGVQAGLEGLKIMGLIVPEQVLQTAVDAEEEEVKLYLENKKIADLLNLPEMTDPKTKVIMKLLMHLHTAAYLAANNNLMVLTMLKMVKMSFKYGNTDTSAFAYVTYGMILADRMDYQTGYELGQLALKLNDKFNNSSLTGKINNIFAFYINPYKKHFKSNLPLHNKSYHFCLETGDLVFGVWVVSFIIWTRFIKGDNLESIYKETEKYLSVVQQLNDINMLYVFTLQQQIILYLQTSHKNKYFIQNEKLDELICLNHWTKNKFIPGLNWYCVLKAQLLYTYENYFEAIKIAQEAEKTIALDLNSFPITEHYFYYSLSLTALYPTATTAEKKEYWKTVENNQEKIKIWADNCPENFLHKYLLVAAEMAWLAGEYTEAMDLYDEAIVSARENEFIQNKALANELAAKFYLARGKVKIAKTYMKDAHYFYSKWGAFAKVKDLEEKYPQLLTKTAIEITEVSTSTTSTTGTNINALDWMTVIKASQALASEIVLDSLLDKLIRIVIENAGAEIGFLILIEQNKPLVATKGLVEKNDIVVQLSPNIRISQCLPISLLNYVERTKENVVLSDATSEGMFTNDPYITTTKPKSVLCTPITHKGKLIGLLYLENNLSSGVFNSAQTEVLTILCSQVAISLENAQLYDNLENTTDNLRRAKTQLEDYNRNLEQKVQERTQELKDKNGRLREQARQLKQALHELRRTQSQLIQSEKMSSLGQMVAGVAHEINNPVNFIYGNINHANEYIKDLVNLIHLYQQHYQNTVPEIQEETEAIDLDFLMQDLPKLLSSMKVGANRIREIVLSLRNFSRLDEAEMKQVDIHEGLDSTLLILQNRIKPKSDFAGIELLKEYGELPLVECYPGQLNQVFMNIIANAIDALEEMETGNTQSPIENPQIRIHTQATNNQIVIAIADNGIGMTEEVQRQLFDPFYTTKPVGKGTGLGLSISYQIVVEKHGGKLNCVSAPGKGTQFIIEIPITQCQ